MNEILKMFHSVSRGSGLTQGCGRLSRGLEAELEADRGWTKLMNENFCGARKVIHKNSALLLPCLPTPQVSHLRGPNYGYLKKVINKVKSQVLDHHIKIDTWTNKLNLFLEVNKN